MHRRHPAEYRRQEGQVYRVRTGWAWTMNSPTPSWGRRARRSGIRPFWRVSSPVRVSSRFQPGLLISIPGQGAEGSDQAPANSDPRIGQPLGGEAYHSMFFDELQAE